MSDGSQVPTSSPTDPTMTYLTPQQQEYLDKMEDMFEKFVEQPDFSSLEQLMKDHIQIQKEISHSLKSIYQYMSRPSRRPYPG